MTLSSAIVFLVAAWMATSCRGFPDVEHSWEELRDGDDRSPCPAMNTLANHGFIARNGRDIPVVQFAQTMENVFSVNMTTIQMFFDIMISIGLPTGIDDTNQTTVMSLKDFYMKYPEFVHDASLVRVDPFLENGNQLSEDLWHLMKNASSDGTVLTQTDLLSFQQARVTESFLHTPEAVLSSGPPFFVLERLADEKVLLLLLGSDALLTRISLAAAQDFLIHHKLPDGYTPRQQRGLEVVDLRTDFSGDVFQYFLDGIQRTLDEMDDATIAAIDGDQEQDELYSGSTSSAYRSYFVQNVMIGTFGWLMA